MKRRRRTTFKPDSSPYSPTWISHTFQEKVRLHAPRLFIAATAVAVATMLAGNAPATLAAPPSPPATNLLQRQLEAAASGTGALVHMRKLQQIADQNGGNRASPGPGYDASVDYFVSVLRKAGWQVSTPEFNVDGDRIRNVIAQTKTGDPNHVVMAGAHLDSVEDGPGMNDNASGSAAWLEIAVRMGGSPEVTNQVRMAWWGAEEIDFNGSTHYVETLTRADRRKIALYLNLDVIASPNVAYLVEGGIGHGDDAGPDGSAEVAGVLAERLAATGVTPERMEYEYGSDYIPFIKAGIPTAGGFTGDDEVKTRKQAALWGGQAGAVCDRCYHESCDRLDNINVKALDRYTDAAAGALAHFAISVSDLPAR
jgi:aminopeptidase S